jgi:hypothetical protein
VGIIRFLKNLPTVEVASSGAVLSNLNEKTWPSDPSLLAFKGLRNLEVKPRAEAVGLRDDAILGELSPAKRGSGDGGKSITF